MGTSMMRAIPISFRFGNGWRFSKQDMEECKEIFIEHAPKDFFDFYNEKLGEREEINVWGKSTRNILCNKIMGRLLWVAMYHPLAKVMRIGMSE
ncbi:MAG: hypothetical protein LBD76_08230 [Prevotellaceae bacterium]|jgi:hypothetical protein|nr:hypothetical protein [Prevotellaceae bacterium]